jgi:DNA (cytosine-5)-methyltransferase 1
MFSYQWHLASQYPAPNIPSHGCTVFGTFVCGGGSTMGYKLAGFTHLGGVEIDSAVASIYQHNHSPNYLYIEDIRHFNARTDLPEDLYNLDILDGSPPCSSFSMAGSREKGWGKEKVFREGQTLQRLDDLVFAYVDTIKKLQPRVAILENVKGLLAGNAKAYAKAIIKQLQEAGYTTQVFLLNAASMGVPQRRERCFFIARKDSTLPPLNLEFSEPPIVFGRVKTKENGKAITGKTLQLWKSLKGSESDLGQVSLRLTGKANQFGVKVQYDEQVSKTLIAGSPMVHRHKPYYISKSEVCSIGSFPQDYDFRTIDAQYLVGMSVPPIMTAHIAWQIYAQWFAQQRRNSDAES